MSLNVPLAALVLLAAASAPLVAQTATAVQTGDVLKPELAAVVGAERFLAEDRPAFRFSQCERKFGGESLCR